MDWESVIQRLEQILQTEVSMVTMGEREWGELDPFHLPDSRSDTRVDQDSLYIRLAGENGSRFEALKVGRRLAPSEIQLIGLVMEQLAADKRKLKTMVSEDEKRALLIRDWLTVRLENGDYETAMPDALASQWSLHNSKIPFLLHGDYSDAQAVEYREFKRLLESFFEEDVVLIPLLDREWLILGSESLLEASGADNLDSDESLEESLEMIGHGLHEMLQNEWMGEFQISITYPITPAKSLLQTILLLRETILLGKRFHFGSNLYFPWRLHLEKLLYSVSDSEKSRFLDQVMKGFDHVLDPEMLMTLELFFSLDCNVSETAKKLYIHRNTLLYRLDKFKQETGRDVRTFQDAVLVKIALLLYKLTKRK